MLCYLFYLWNGSGAVYKFIEVLWEGDEVGDCEGE